MDHNPTKILIDPDSIASSDDAACSRNPPLVSWGLCRHFQIAPDEYVMIIS
jgi:hypothetical protein